MHSYQNSPSWTTYREIVERESGLTFSVEPIEVWQEIRGHRVHIDVWSPATAPLGTVVLVHGGGGNGRILAPFAHALVTRGWRVLSPDLPGYGLTSWADGFRPDYREWPAIIAALADEQSEPCALAGFSVGGMTAVLASAAARRTVPVVATTLLDMTDPRIFRKAARWPVVGALSLVGFRLLPGLIDRLVLPLRMVAPLARMSSSAAITEYFRTDPLLGGLRVPVRFYRKMHEYEPVNRVDGVPVLLAHPGADAWTPAAWSIDWLRSSVIHDARVLVTQTGSHLPLEPESFTAIVRATDQFLRERLQPQD